MSDAERANRIIEQSRATIRRVDEMLAKSKSGLRSGVEFGSTPDPVEQTRHTEPVETTRDRHIREIEQDDKIMQRERRKFSTEMRELAELRQASEQHRAELANGLSVINKLAEAFHDRIEEQAAELTELRTKLLIADQRITDLLCSRNHESKGEVIDIPKIPLRRV